MKGLVIAQLGDGAMLLPDLVADALKANDRLKYHLSLLQAAEAHAETPDRRCANLRAEREACGVDEPSLDAALIASHFVSPGVLYLPGAHHVASAIESDLALMLAPFEKLPDSADAARQYAMRRDALTPLLDGWAEDSLPSADVALVTGTGDQHDTVHRLVMDLHRGLTGLQADLAAESIDGARAYGVTEPDRRLVAAFMRGVNETAPLKFDHPGLGTTATRIDDHLSIQNDIGTTDVHVLVLTVRDLSVTVTYTDIHHSRDRFFRSLLQPWDVVWQETSRAHAEFSVSTGEYRAPDANTLERYLTHLGSRLVFLIDWRKARKSLSRLVASSQARAVLKWAADQNVGHRGFLEVGESAVQSVFERGNFPQLRYGLKLDEILGTDAARALLESVLRLSSEGLRGGRSRRLIADEIEAELLSRMGTTSRMLLMWAADHAAHLAALNERCLRVLMHVRGSDARPEAVRAATLATEWEHRADRIVRRAGSLPLHAREAVLGPLLTTADVAANALEDAIFLLTLMPPGAGAVAERALAPLAQTAGRACRAYVQCLEHASEFPAPATHRPASEVLIAVDRLLQIEHEADAAARAAEARLVAECAGFRELHVLSRVADALESSVDALKRCALLVRDFVLTDAAVLR